MFKKILAGLLVSVSLLSVAAIPTYWKPHKYDAVIYRLDLGGVAPTATHVENNNIKVGDVIVDTYNNTQYVITETATPLYVTWTSSGLGVDSMAVSSNYIIIGDSSDLGSTVAISGDIGITTAGVVSITANVIAEADLKAVDSAADEDFLTYESTTGDFEWHSVSDVSAAIAADIAEGELANSIILTADIKDGEIVNADLNAAAGITEGKLAIASNKFLIGSAANVGAAFALSGDIFSTVGGVIAIQTNVIAEADLKAVDTAVDEDFLTYESTTGDFEWHSIADVSAAIAADIGEGELANSIILTADIKDGEIVNADLNSAAGITEGKLAVASNKFLIGSSTGVGSAFALSGEVTCTTGGVVTIAADAIDGGNIADDAVGAEHIETLDAAVLTSVNIGTVVGATSVSAELGGYRLLTIPFNVSVTGTNDGVADEGVSSNLYTFTQGIISIQSVVINATLTNSAAFNVDAADTFVFGVGTGAAAADNGLTGTEQDLVAAQTIQTDTGGGANTIVTRAVQTHIATAPGLFDGHTTAVSIYLNVALEDDNTASNPTVGCSGTMYVLAAFAGDY